MEKMGCRHPHRCLRNPAPAGIVGRESCVVDPERAAEGQASACFVVITLEKP